MVTIGEATILNVGGAAMPPARRSGRHARHDRGGRARLGPGGTARFEWAIPVGQRAAADHAGVRAMYYLEDGTPEAAINMAKRWFGEGNVFTFAAG